MEAWLNFIILNNTYIIVGISALLSILLAFLFLRNFLFKIEETSSSLKMQEVDLSRIESLIVNLQQKNSALSENKESVDEVKDLKNQLEQTKQELNHLKSQQTVQLNNEEEIKKYLDKISELESKLLEYEIIAEDIADLSRFKEENIKLKNKIEELEKKQALNQQNDQKSITSSNEELIDDRVLDQFAKTVNEQKMMIKETNPNSHVVENQDQNLELKDINVSAIEKEALKMPQIDEETSNVLETQLDTEKLIKEADDLQKNQEDGKILGDFESFIEKEGKA